MAYFTGTANNPSDLLGKLRTHAETLGWVTDRASASEWLCHNADGYWSFNAGSNQWRFSPAIRGSITAWRGTRSRASFGAEQPVFVERSNHSAAQRRAIHALSPVRHRCLSAPSRRNRCRSVPSSDDRLPEQAWRRLYRRSVCLRLVHLQPWPSADKQLVVAPLRWLSHSVQWRRQRAAAGQPRR